ncbi:MAG: peptide chain release factor N(5)-glutamine methyltransferase [Leptospirales bacterium]|nr:peptide chain release factor N(5)-glutamine methyltransferase [Leptospirales bacterium]
MAEQDGKVEKSTVQTVAAVLAQALRRLRDAELESPAAEAAYLLADLLHKDRAWLLAHDEEQLTLTLVERFQQRVEQRCQHRPLAQICGRREFFGRSFLVTEATLIPRPETELLVSEILARLDGRPKLILDLCCGSGCIGLSLLAERNQWQAVLTDLSPAALDVARQNAASFPENIAARARFCCGDLYEALAANAAALSEKSLFDAVVCNPPYIHPDEMESLAPEVRDFEPALALFSDDPLDLIQRIAAGAREALRPPGLLLIETSPRYAAAGQRALHNFFQVAEVLHDLAGLPRALCAYGVS